MTHVQHMLLTGCASGMARHLTGALLRAGHRVCATDVDVEALGRAARDEAWDGSRVRLERLDVTDAEAWQRVLDAVEAEAGPLDVVMNIAGVLEAGWIDDITPAAIRRHVRVNLEGTMLGTTLAAQRMAARGAGHVVNFGSMSSLMPVAGLAAYTASKYGVRGFSLAVAYELRQRGVYVTVVCPDPVQTPMVASLYDRPAAAMIFSSGRHLAVAEIERLILDRVLPRRPLEAGYPRARALQARLVGFFARVGLWVTPLLLRLGRARLEAHRRRALASGPAR